jgi:hypothetical protein
MEYGLKKHVASSEKEGWRPAGMSGYAGNELGLPKPSLTIATKASE